MECLSAFMFNCFVHSLAYLTRMVRDQSFYTWLVAWDQTADKAYIMKTIKWILHWNVDVDPNKPQGGSNKSTVCKKNNTHKFQN